MKFTKLPLITALLLSLSVVPACGNKKEEEAKKAAEAAKKAKKAEKPKAPKKAKPKVKLAELSPSTPRTKLGDVPAAADLELEADRTVAIENLEAELDRLEAEIVTVGE
jgi:hypothetical protein